MVEEHPLDPLMDSNHRLRNIMHCSHGYVDVNTVCTEAEKQFGWSHERTLIEMSSDPLIVQVRSICHLVWSDRNTTDSILEIVREDASKNNGMTSLAESFLRCFDNLVPLGILTDGDLSAILSFEGVHIEEFITIDLPKEDLSIEDDCEDFHEGLDSHIIDEEETDSADYEEATSYEEIERFLRNSGTWVTAKEISESLSVNESNVETILNGMFQKKTALKHCSEYKLDSKDPNYKRDLIEPLMNAEAGPMVPLKDVFGENSPTYIEMGIESSEDLEKTLSCIFEGSCSEGMANCDIIKTSINSNDSTNSDADIPEQERMDDGESVQDSLKDRMLDYLKSRNGFCPEFKMVEKFGSEPDFEKSMKEILSSSDVLMMNTLLLYREYRKGDIGRVVELLKDTVDQGKVDTNDAVTRHCTEFREMKLLTAPEINSFLSKMCPDATTPVKGRFTLSSLLDYVAKESGRDTTENTDKLRYKIDEVMIPNQYLSASVITTRYNTLHNDDQINLETVTRILDGDDRMLRRYPSYYRLLDVSKEQLHGIVDGTISSMPFDEVQCNILFTRCNVACKRAGMMNSDELCQVILRHYPEARCTKKSMIKLSPLKKERTSENKPNVLQTTVPTNHAESADDVMGRAKELITEFMSSGKAYSINSILANLIKHGMDDKTLRGAIDELVKEHTLFKDAYSFRMNNKVSLEMIEKTFSEFRNSIYTTYKLYELKRKELNNMDVRIHEMPSVITWMDRAEIIDQEFKIVSFDGAGMDSLDELYKECEGIKDFCNSAFKKYGIPQQFSKSYVEKSESCDGAKSSVNPEHLEKLRSLLTEKYYTEDQIKSLVNDDWFDDSYLGPDVLKKLGFRKKGNIVFSKDFSDPVACVRSVLRNSDIIRLTDEMRKDVNVSKAIDECLANYEIMDMGGDQFITSRRLSRYNITTEDLRGFSTYASNFSGDRTFTYRSLRNDGFKKLSELGFDTPFYNSLLIESKLFKYSEMDGVVVFNRRRTPTLGMILEQMMEKEPRYDIHDLRDELESHYGIKKEKSSLLHAIKNTSLYYNEDMETVFRSLEDLRRFAYDTA